MSATQYDIKSQDIALINQDEVFAIDTNVLLWTHYSKASDPKLKTHPYQVKEYPGFIAKLLANGNRLVTTVLNISELITVVERKEYEIYKLVNNCGNLKLKQYRNLPNERLSYQNEISHILNEIKSSYNDQIEVIEITKENLERFCQEIDQTKCDIFDYIVIEYLKSINITNYISDDKDFLDVDGINLYTTYDNQITL